MSFSPKKYSVRIKDLFKSLLMAGGTAGGIMIQKITDQALLGTTPAFPVWKLVTMAAIAAACCCLLQYQQ